MRDDNDWLIAMWRKSARGSQTEDAAELQIRRMLDENSAELSQFSDRRPLTQKDGLALSQEAALFSALAQRTALRAVDDLRHEVEARLEALEAKSALRLVG
jgi:hypothetical protein